MGSLFHAAREASEASAGLAVLIPSRHFHPPKTPDFSVISLVWGVYSGHIVKGKKR